MGLFRRKRDSTTGGDSGGQTTGSHTGDHDGGPTGGPTANGAPPQRGECACPEHIDDLVDLAVPLTQELREEFGEESFTVGELVDMAALGVDPAETQYFFDPRSGRQDDGPYHWTIWFGDEARGCYDDDAPLQLDESVDARPGVELVAWEDREVMHVGAPTLCGDGVLAAAARALLDDRVRLAGD
jgi:hypothetical protein